MSEHDGAPPLLLPLHGLADEGLTSAPLASLLPDMLLLLLLLRPRLMMVEIVQTVSVARFK